MSSTELFNLSDIFFPTNKFPSRNLSPIFSITLERNHIFSITRKNVSEFGPASSIKLENISVYILQPHSHFYLSFSKPWRSNLQYPFTPRQSDVPTAVITVKLEWTKPKVHSNPEYILNASYLPDCERNCAAETTNTCTVDNYHMWPVSCVSLFCSSECES